MKTYSKISNIDFSPLLEEMLEQRKKVQISLSGLSMFPFLMHGDIVQIDSIDLEKLNRGDVVVYKIDDKWIAHRLIKHNRKKNLYYMRGDSRIVKDIPIKPEQIKGVVSKIIKSRWKLAHFAIGKHKKYITLFSPITAPIFNFWLWVRNNDSS